MGYWRETLQMKKTQKQKIEKELYKYLDKIFDDLWGGELSFDEIINEIFIKVILEMKINADYDIKKISNTFKIALYQAVERECSMSRDEVVSIINEKTH